MLSVISLSHTRLAPKNVESENYKQILKRFQKISKYHFTRIDSIVNGKSDYHDLKLCMRWASKC